MLMPAGCTDSRTDAYDPMATADDGRCPEIVYGCRDPGTKLDGVKLAPVTAKTSKTGPRHVVRHTITIAPGDACCAHDEFAFFWPLQARKFRVVTPIDLLAQQTYYIDVPRAALKEKRMKLRSTEITLTVPESATKLEYQDVEHDEADATTLRTLSTVEDQHKALATLEFAVGKEGTVRGGRFYSKVLPWGTRAGDEVKVTMVEEVDVEVKVEVKGTMKVTVVEKVAVEAKVEV